MKRPGISVIEVIIALGLAAIVIAAVGNLIGATHRLTSATGREIQATAFAREWIELASVPAKTNAMFGCSCGATNPCAGNICNNGQSCTPRPGFNSCWVPLPTNVAPFTFTGGGPWTANDPTLIGFVRKMTVENIGGVANTKKITVDVCWNDNDCTDPANNRNRTMISTIITAWKNF